MKPTSGETGEDGSVKEPIPVPAWIVSLGKLVLTAAASVAIAYARFSATEKEASDAHELGKANEAKIEAKSEVISQLSAQVGRIDLKETMMEKSIGDSLARIESSVKDLRADVKEIQTRAQSKP